MKRNFNAFTLAEVLITLGIIGVVAAMTMPTLINQTNGAQYKAAYKKALSAISQAVTLNVALDDESFADTIAGQAGKLTAGNGATDESKTEGTTIASLLNSRINVIDSDGGDKYTANKQEFPGTIEAKVCTTGTGEDKTVTVCGKDETPTTETIKPDTFLYFNDGITFAFQSSDKECKKDTPCNGIIDVNGPKGPNKVVSCDAKATGDTSTDCTVSNPTDIYPVVFYDQTILPASDAAAAVLYGK